MTVLLIKAELSDNYYTYSWPHFYALPLEKVRKNGRGGGEAAIGNNIQCTTLFRPLMNYGMHAALMC